MDIIITINDTDATVILEQIQAAYGWHGLTNSEIATQLSGEIKNDLVRRALSGKDALDRVAAQAAAKILLGEKLTVAVKA